MKINKINGLESPYSQDIIDKKERNKKNQNKLLKILSTQYNEKIYNNIKTLKLDMDFDKYSNNMNKAKQQYIREFRLLFL